MVKIEVLGKSCAKSKSLLKNVDKAVQESGIQADIIEVDSIQEIMDRGVMIAPALYLDSESKIMGKTATMEEIKRDCGEIKQRLMDEELNQVTSHGSVDVRVAAYSGASSASIRQESWPSF